MEELTNKEIVNMSLSDLEDYDKEHTYTDENVANYVRNKLLYKYTPIQKYKDEFERLEKVILQESFEEPSLEITVSRAFNKADGKVPETIDFNNKTYKQAMVMSGASRPNENTVIFYVGDDVNSSDDYFYVIYTLNKIGENSYKGVENVSEVVDCTKDDTNTIEESKEVKMEDKEDIKTALTKLDVHSFEDLKTELEKLFSDEILEDDDCYDLMEIVETDESNCEDYIRRRSEVTNTDWKDEIAIEDAEVQATLNKIIDSVSALLKEGVTKEEVKEKLTEGTDSWTDITENDVQLYMNTWGNYNQYGADAEAVNGGWMSLDEAEEWLKDHAEEECFINDTDFPENLNIEVSDYSNPQFIIDQIRDFINCDDQEALNAIMESTGYDLEECLDILNRGDYYYISNVTDEEDLARAYIDQVYGEEHLSDMGVDTLSRYVDEDTWREEIEEGLRDSMGDEEPDDQMIDDLLQEEIDTADEFILAQHFDYDQYGRDMLMGDWNLTSTGAVATF